MVLKYVSQNIRHAISYSYQVAGSNSKAFQRHGKINGNRELG
jgi:hypothetical protein